MKSALMFLIIFVTLYAIAVLLLQRRRNLDIYIPFSRDLTTVGKGVAIAIIIYGHLGNLFNIRYLTPLGGIGVAMFLILSGFGINESWKKNGLQRFWSKRLVGVMLPYVIVEAVTIPIRGGYQSVPEALLDLTGIHSKYYLGWYITYQMAWYIIYYCTMRTIKKPKIRYAIWVLIGVAVLSFGSMLYARQAFTFTIGILLSDYKDSAKSLSKKKNVVLIGAFGVLLLAVKQIPVFRTTPDVVQNFLDMVMASCIAISLLNIIRLIKKKYLIPFYYLGIISFELYLIHGYTLWLVDLTFMNALMFFAVTIATAAIAHFILKKVQDVLLSTRRLEG